MEIKEEKNRFVLYNEQKQEIGEITFSLAGEELIIIDHTYVDDAYRGQGAAAKLVLAVVEKMRLEHKEIIPLCPFAKKEFEQKKEYQDVWHH